MNSAVGIAIFLNAVHFLRFIVTCVSWRRHARNAEASVRPEGPTSDAEEANSMALWAFLLNLIAGLLFMRLDVAPMANALLWPSGIWALATIATNVYIRK